MSLLIEDTTPEVSTEPMAVVSPVETPAYESALLWALLGCLATLFGVLMATYQYYTKRNSRPRAKRERKRRLEQEKRRHEQQRIRSIPTDPVLVEHFFSTLNKKIKNGDLEIEYKALNGHMQSRRCSRVAGVKICDNKLLHPLFNAVPYEHSRVNLKNTDGEDGSDQGINYNASWIDGFNRPKAYVAAQGPTSSSVSTFWLLVWQERISCIVMVTNLFEHSKEQCCKYWDSAVRWYGDLEVRLDKTHNTADCTIRTLIIRKRGCDDSRTVRQFAINSWSYHHCPNVTTVLEFRRRVRAFMVRSAGPVLVHCGLGTGRTGTYIAIDGLLDRVERDGTVNVYAYVNQMRKCRCGLVETKDQYEFIYKCLAMYIQCGCTVLKAHSFQEQLDLMVCKDPRLKMNAFERQFKILHHIVRPLTVGECAAGHRKENRHKSRNILIQPPERARPYLLTHDNNKSTDFINAVYVDGYRSLNAYIATEWPLTDTMNDIWRMVLDCDVSCIVLLDDPGASTMYPQFWPCSLGLPVRYGPIVVELQWSGVENNIKSWLFHVRKRITTLFAGDTPRKSSDDRVVRMFQTSTWLPTQTVPANGSVFIELLSHVNKWRDEVALTSPICIISKTGVERVGMFSVIHAVKDQLDADDEVDIFRAVKIVRRNRPQLVCNMTEFIYCYTFMSMLLEYQKSQQNPNIPQIVISCPDEELESRSLLATQSVTQAGLSNLKNSLLYGSGTSDAFMDRYSFSDVSSIISVEALDLNEDSQKAWLGLELDGAKYFLPARPSLPKEETDAFDRLEYLNSLKALREPPPPIPRRGRRASEPAVSYSQLKNRRVSDTPRRPSVSWKQELLSYSKPPKLIVTPTLPRLASSQDDLPQTEVILSLEPSSDQPSPVKQCNTNGVLATSTLLTRNGGNLLTPNGLFKLSGSSLSSRSSKSSDGSQVYHTPSGSPLFFNHLDNDLRQTLKWISADSVFNME